HPMTSQVLHLATTAAGEGSFRSAARLLGAAEALYESFGVPMVPWDRLAYDKYLPLIQAALDVEAFEAMRAEGKALTLPAALTEANAVGTETQTAPKVVGPASTSNPARLPVNAAGLTEREVEVLRLVAQGLTS